MKVALEHYGPEVTGARVTVDSAEARHGRRKFIVAGELQVRIARKVLTHRDLLRKGGIEGALEALKGLLKRP